LSFTPKTHGATVPSFGLYQLGLPSDPAPAQVPKSRQPPVVCKQTVVDQSSGDLIYQSPDIIIDATRKVVDEARSRK
jgi:hypothetical protein